MNEALKRVLLSLRRRACSSKSAMSSRRCVCLVCMTLITCASGLEISLYVSARGGTCRVSWSTCIRIDLVECSPICVDENVCKGVKALVLIARKPVFMQNSFVV